MQRLLSCVIRSPTFWRGRRAGTGSTINLVSIFLMIAGIGMATGTALLLSNTLQHGVVPAALKAFMAMFGS